MHHIRIHRTIYKWSTYVRTINTIDTTDVSFQRLDWGDMFGLLHQHSHTVHSFPAKIACCHDVTFSKLATMSFSILFQPCTKETLSKNYMKRHRGFAVIGSNVKRCSAMIRRKLQTSFHIPRRVFVSVEGCVMSLLHPSASFSFKTPFTN